MGVLWWVALVVVLAVSACTGGGGDGASPDEGTRLILRSIDEPDVVIEATVVDDAARAHLRIASSVVAEERRVGRRYFARVRGAEAVLGVDRWVSFDLADRDEAAIARRIGPGLLELVDGGVYDGYEVERRVLAAPEDVEVPAPEDHVPVRSLPEAVRAPR